MASQSATAFTSDWLNIPASDGSIINFTGAFSEWDVFRQVGGRITHGSDVPIIQEMMDAIEEERNAELKRKTRIIGEALDALNNFSEFKNAKWFGRGDSWTRTYAGPDNECEWPEHRTWAHFMLWPLEGEIPETLEQAEEDADYEAWINSKQYVKSLEEYNRHKLLAWDKEMQGEHPKWSGEYKELTQSPNHTDLLNSYIKERYNMFVDVKTLCSDGNTYSKGTTPYGDVYIPNKIANYLKDGCGAYLMDIALQDVEGPPGKGPNSFRWTCVYLHNNGYAVE